MPKARKRKLPVVQTPHTVHAPSTSAQSCRSVIRRFHTLLKQRRQVENSLKSGRNADKHTASIVDIDRQINELGGLEHYQHLSSLGQSNERGGGSEKVFIAWLKDLHMHKREGHSQLKLLEVGALRHDNYRACDSWIECSPIDLHSRHPQIMEQDFLQLDQEANKQKWNIISLSLVVNFVPEPQDRGTMLKLAYDFLTPEGLLFLALPLPCVANSRYLTFVHLHQLMESIGFHKENEKYRDGGRMAYWLYRKREPNPTNERFDKKVVLQTGHRNNFAILLKGS